MAITESSGGPFRILGIESREGLQNLFTSIFSEQGYIYENYQTLEDALRSIERDVNRDIIMAVVVDNYAPGKEDAMTLGPLLRHLKDLLPERPIIMVTTDTLNEEARRRYIFEEGFWDVLPMPFDNIWMIGESIRLTNLPSF